MAAARAAGSSDYPAFDQRSQRIRLVPATKPTRPRFCSGLRSPAMGCVRLLFEQRTPKHRANGPLLARYAAKQQRPCQSRLPLISLGIFCSGSQLSPPSWAASWDYVEILCSRLDAARQQIGWSFDSITTDRLTRRDQDGRPRIAVGGISRVRRSRRGRRVFSGLARYTASFASAAY